MIYYVMDRLTATLGEKMKTQMSKTLDEIARTLRDIELTIRDYSSDEFYEVGGYYVLTENQLDYLNRILRYAEYAHSLSEEYYK